jgi:thiol-disulfide isomerase/thioredoxin
MRLFGLLVLYTALSLGANATLAQGLDFSPYLIGDMEKLVPAAAPTALGIATLIDEANAPRGLEEFKGKVLLVNFWATWCAPCRKELGALDRLQAELGGDRFQVVTIATGRNPIPAIQKLFAEEKITGLPILRDPDQSFSRASGVLALPVTLIVDRDGNEIARLLGDATWDGPEAKALIAALVSSP